MSESMRPHRDAADPKTVSRLEKRKTVTNVGNDKTGTSQEANKRARRSTCTFHHCHLTMLQSLYQEDGDEDTWRMIDLFLQRRPLLMKRIRERSNLRSVHEEAILVQQRLSASSPPHYQSPPGTMANPQLSPRTSMFSPHRSPSTVPQRRRPNSLGLVCRLLRRKAAASNATLQELAKPYCPLRKATDERLKGLEEMLDTLRQERLEKHGERMCKLISPAMSDSFRSHLASRWGDGGEDDDKIALVESKIRLWRMLAHALEEVV